MKKMIRSVMVILFVLSINITSMAKSTECEVTSYEEFKEYVEKVNNGDYDPPEFARDIYSKEELNLMAYLIEAEVTGESFESKCNVSSVIWNRLNSDSNDFKNIDTIKEVVYQKSQFSPTFDGRLWLNKPTQETLDAIEYTFVIGDTTNGATYFHSGKSSWHKNNLEYLFTDDSGHKFYK